MMKHSRYFLVRFLNEILLRVFSISYIILLMVAKVILFLSWLPRQLLLEVKDKKHRWYKVIEVPLNLLVHILLYVLEITSKSVIFLGSVRLRLG